MIRETGVVRYLRLRTAEKCVFQTPALVPPSADPP